MPQTLVSPKLRYPEDKYIKKYYEIYPEVSHF